MSMFDKVPDIHNFAIIGMEENETLKQSVEEKQVEKKLESDDYITLDFRGLSLPWAIVLSTIIFTAGIGSAVYFGIKARPVVQGNTTTQTPTQQTQTYEPSSFAEASTTVSNGPIIGDEKAKVFIIEYSDFVCPYCQKFYSDAFQSIKKEYIDSGKVALVYRNFPLSFHEPAATYVAKAGICVNKLYGDAKFAEFHNSFFSSVNSYIQNAYDTNNNPVVNMKQTAFDAMLPKLGLDASKVTNCINSTDAANILKNDQTDLKALEKDVVERGLSQGLGTPALLVGVKGKNGVVTGRLIEGAYPYQAFKNVIEEQLTK